MTNDTNEATVGSLVADRPGRARVFEKYGIDYCCGGARSLAEACGERGVDAAAVAADLEAYDAAHTGDPGPDAEATTPAALADYVVATHHAYLREALPRLARLAAKVARAHGARHPETVEAARIFTAFAPAMEQHMEKEEMILFPMVRQLQAGEGGGFHCGSVANPVRVMMLEHDDAGADLARFRTLLHDYEPPADACNTFRAMLDGFRELEEDTHRHVHLENNVLFPAALRLEAGGRE